MGEEITLIQLFTIAAAFGGLLLGVINTVRSLTRDRERLALMVEDEMPHVKELNERNPVIVRVVNVGYYPVTLYDFMLLRGPFKPPVGLNYYYRFEWYHETSPDHIDLSPRKPICLAPGEEFRFQIWRDKIDRPASEKIDPRDVTGVCAVTASGKRFCRRSGLLRRYLRGDDNP